MSFNFKEEKKRQELIVIFYGVAVIFFIALRFLRKNPEFLFFSGILDSLFIIYNYRLLHYQKVTISYFFLTLISFIVSFWLMPEGLSMRFPLITLLFTFITRLIFLRINKREPKVDLLLAKNTDRIYSLILFIFCSSLWIYIIVNNQAIVNLK